MVLGELDEGTGENVDSAQVVLVPSTLPSVFRIHATQGPGSSEALRPCHGAHYRDRVQIIRVIISWQVQYISLPDGIRHVVRSPVRHLPRPFRGRLGNFFPEYAYLEYCILHGDTRQRATNRRYIEGIYWQLFRMPSLGDAQRGS